MWLTSTSIRRPVFILMVVTALIVLGWSAMSKMNLEQNPKVDFPFVAVITSYPGAGPEEIETQVTKKIEDAVASVNGVKSLTSSSQEGVSSVNIEFNLGVASDVAAADVRDRIAQTRVTLPVDVLEPVVIKFDVNAMPIMFYGLTGNRPSRDIRDIADNVIKPRLGKVPGVAAINVTGGDVREISVGVRKERLDAYGITISQLVQLLKANTLNFPVGHIVEGPRETNLRVIGEYQNAQQIADTRLRMPNGQTVRLSDIADVRDSVKERRDITRIDRRDSVGIVIQKTSEANTVSVAQGVKREIEAIQRDLPKDMKFIVNSDTSIEVEESVHDVQTSLILGAFLAVLVVYVFLHSARGTLIVAIAIPTSIMATFLPMWAFGFTLNGMTLLALSLSVGILVDDSIVVLENIYRHLHRGETPEQAAVNGRSEIGLAAITITLVDCVVFLPIAFMGGISGMFFRSFGITVAVATLFSLFMSFTLTPMLASRWYRPGEGGHATRGIFGAFNRFYSFLDNSYRRILGWALRYRGIIVYVGTGMLFLIFIVIASSVSRSFAGMPMMMGMFLVFGLIMLWRYRILGLIVTGAGVAAVFFAYGMGMAVGRPLLNFRFAPDQDQGLISITGELPAGTSLARTMEVVERVEKVVADTPDVRSNFVSVGSTSGGMFGQGSTGPQFFTMSAKLKDKVSLGDSINPFADTKGMRTRSDSAIADDIRSRAGQIPGTQLMVSNVTGFGGGGSPMQVDITGNNIDELTALGNKVLTIFKEEPGVINPDISIRIGRPEQQIAIDREKAAQYGLSVAQIATALRTSIEGDDTTVFREGGNEYRVRVHFDEENRKSAAELESIIVGTTTGAGGSSQPVRLADVARTFPATGPTKIDRKNRQKLVSVTSDLKPGYATGNLRLNIDKKLANITWGANSFAWGGENQTQAEEGVFMMAALGMAVLLVYMLMAALFNNLLHPLVIMLSLPQAMVGALLGLIVAGHALSIVSMIGIIMLMGLVTKNAILLVDYTNTLRERGLERTEAILQAGPTRLRPIMMTTIAMVAGMLPTALGLGRGAEFRAPLATPVIGGLILSTMLTLLVIPCVYTYFDDLSSFIGRMKSGGLRRRRTATTDPVRTEPELAPVE